METSFDHSRDEIYVTATWGGGGVIGLARRQRVALCVAFSFQLHHITKRHLLHIVYSNAVCQDLNGDTRLGLITSSNTRE